jgi:F-type H+-transporting ATPase subunit c
MNSDAIIALVAGAAVVIAGAVASFAIGRSTSKAVESAARQPEAADKVLRILVLGASLIEATAVYALLIALLIVFFK